MISRRTNFKNKRKKMEKHKENNCFFFSKVLWFIFLVLGLYSKGFLFAPTLKMMFEVSGLLWLDKTNLFLLGFLLFSLYQNHITTSWQQALRLTRSDATRRTFTITDSGNNRGHVQPSVRHDYYLFSFFENWNLISSTIRVESYSNLRCYLSYNC